MGASTEEVKPLSEEETFQFDNLMKDKTQQDLYSKFQSNQIKGQEFKDATSGKQPGEIAPIKAKFVPKWKRAYLASLSDKK